MRPWRLLLPIPLVIPLVIPLAACQGDDATREGTWRATGMNDANLRAMVDDPRDLDGGRAAIGSRGQAGAVAVERLLAGRRFPLPASNLTRVAPGAVEPGTEQGGGNAR